MTFASNIGVLIRASKLNIYCLPYLLMGEDVIHRRVNVEDHSTNEIYK